MSTVRVKQLLAPAILFVAAALSLAQDPPKKLSVQQMEEFLKGAKVVDIKALSTGVTNSQRADLSDGTITHHAHVQSIDESKSVFQGDRGTELNFRDTWKYNVAGYRLARILGIDDMVPPSVERSVAGKTSSVTWWIDRQHDGGRPPEEEWRFRTRTLESRDVRGARVRSADLQHRPQSPEPADRPRIPHLDDRPYARLPDGTR